MFLFLIELFLLGVATTKYFTNKLPNFFLAVSSILLGYFFYFLNGFILLLIGIPLQSVTMIVFVTIELLGLIVHQIITKRLFYGVPRSLWLNYLGVAVVYFGVLTYFCFNNYFFATTDSVYMVVMGKNLVESGFSHWYFASPRGMGLFVPFIQTIGMIFGLDYSWFIQPAFMLAFIALFCFFGYRALSKFIKSLVIKLLLIGSVIVLYLSTDLIFISSTYIHTNFDSGLFLFLALSAIYFGIEEENKAWFYFVPTFLIAFGAIRTENVILSLIFILIYSGSQRISREDQKWIFLPYLTFQFVVNLRILFMDSLTYSDQLSNTQLAITLLGIAAVAGWIYIPDAKKLKRKVLPILFWLIPVGLLMTMLALGFFNFDQLISNLQVNLTATFTTGNWDSFWWVILTLSVLLSYSIRFSQKRELLALIWSFFLMVEVLGLMRHPYHEFWYDSANRMLEHIAPVILFYFLILVSRIGSTANHRVVKSTEN